MALAPTWGGRHHYSHFTDGKIEAGEVNLFPQVHKDKMVGLGLKLPVQNTKLSLPPLPLTTSPYDRSFPTAVQWPKPQILMGSGRKQRCMNWAGMDSGDSEKTIVLLSGGIIGPVMADLPIFEMMAKISILRWNFLYTHDQPKCSGTRNELQVSAF